MIRKFLKNILGENFTENNAKLATVNFAINSLVILNLCEQLNGWHPFGYQPLSLIQGNLITRMFGQLIINCIDSRKYCN